MQKDTMNTNEKVEQVRQIFSHYVCTMGCLNTSIHKLWGVFSEISLSAPEFHDHFSTLARTAIGEDARHQHQTYPIRGTMEEEFDLTVGDPVIFSGKPILQDWNKSHTDSQIIVAPGNMSPKTLLLSYTQVFLRYRRMIIWLESEQLKRNTKERF